MPTEYKGWPSLLYYHLITSGKHDVAVVAAAMGISPSSLYKYAEGECNFSPDLIPRLYNATHEKEFLDFLVKGTDQMITPRPRAQATARALELETLDVTATVGELAAHVRRALEDGKLSEIELKQIERALNELQRGAEEVRQRVKSKA